MKFVGNGALGGAPSKITQPSLSSNSINGFLKSREQTLFFFIQAYGYTLQIEVPQYFIAPR
jgi:hypothetical protein